MSSQYPQPTARLSSLGGQVQPMFWQGVIAAMVNIMILIALGAWVFSQVKKAAKGEEVDKPF